MPPKLDEYLSKGKDWLQENGMITLSEIFQQPAMWRDTAERFVRLAPYLTALPKAYGLMDVYHYEPVGLDLKRPHEIIFTGAGTSHFVGLTVKDAVSSALNIRALAIPTTDIVTCPEDAFGVSWENWPTLLVSFARSGNSPESLAVFNIAKKKVHKIRHLVVTCNEDGQLAEAVRTSQGGDLRSSLLVLNSATNDQGLAMTSSFTSMAIAGLGLAYLYKKDGMSQYIKDVEKTAQAAERLLNNYSKVIEESVNRLWTIKRACFLGSRSNYGAAIESHLKLQEMTNGIIVCLADTFLGVRHGPRAFVHNDTLVVYYLSTIPEVRRYEMDLIRQDIGQNISATNIIVSGSDPDGEIGRLIKNFKSPSYLLNLGLEYDLPDYLLAPVYTIVGQLFGFFFSIKNGLKPDSPSDNKTINRVVEGVTIYD